MKCINTTITHYEAVDGTVFSFADECKLYEASLPKELVFTLESGYTSEQLNEVAHYELGYTTEQASEQYESPGFLREGGYYTTYDVCDHSLEIVYGTLSEVINYAFKTRWAKNYGKYIRKTKVTDLTNA